MRLRSAEQMTKWQRESRRRRWEDDPVKMWSITSCQAAKQRARQAGLPHSITPGYIEHIARLYCPVLDIYLAYERSSGVIRPDSPTLDRHDNALGYVEGNVCVISWRANAIKNNATVAELEAVLSYARDMRAELWPGQRSL